MVQAFLVDFLDSTLSCRFGNFLCNSERERQQDGISDHSGCIWMYLENLRASTDGVSHVHFNLFYDPVKYDGPLLPPAAALAPTLWPQFHLRWACPSETQSGEIENQCRAMNKEYSDAIKAKDIAEAKAEELKTDMESLVEALEREKQKYNSAVIRSNRMYKENKVIKRAIQTLGCKLHLSNTGNSLTDMGIAISETRDMTYQQPRESDEEDKFDMLVSISSDEHVTSNENRVCDTICDTLCPLRTKEGCCKWPDAGCSQAKSQFLGLKANFDAFDRLSIHDTYFGSD